MYRYEFQSRAFPSCNYLIGIFYTKGTKSAGFNYQTNSKNEILVHDLGIFIREELRAIYFFIIIHEATSKHANIVHIFIHLSFVKM